MRNGCFKSSSSGRCLRDEELRILSFSGLFLGSSMKLLLKFGERPKRLWGPVIVWACTWLNDFLLLSITVLRESICDFLFLSFDKMARLSIDGFLRTDPKTGWAFDLSENCRHKKELARWVFESSLKSEVPSSVDLSLRMTFPMSKLRANSLLRILFEFVMCLVKSWLVENFPFDLSIEQNSLLFILRSFFFVFVLSFS